MKYFTDVITFVDAHLIWVFFAFFAAVLVELIVFLIKKKANYGIFSWDNFYITVVSNITVLLGLYVVACLVVGFINCIKDQNWRFWATYTEFLNGGVAPVIFSIVFIGAIITFLIIFDIDVFLLRLIAAAAAAALATVVAVFVGFALYVVVAIIIVILKLIWFVFSGFFLSIYQFITKYWQMILTVMLTPGVLYGMICAFINYITSLKEEVFD